MLSEAFADSIGHAEQVRLEFSSIFKGLKDAKVQRGLGGAQRGWPHLIHLCLPAV